MTFDELGLPKHLVAALTKQNITIPMAIQSASMPVILEGKDVFIHSETGTGKTLAYLLPLFCKLDSKLAATQLVVMAPTHELAIQIQRQCCDLAQNAGMPLRTLLLIGGTSIDRQLDKLKKKPHIVVGSPGRIHDLLQMGKLKGPTFRTIVVDEADRLLSSENLDSVKAIISSAPHDRQLIFVSATDQPQSAEIINTLAPHHLRLKTSEHSVNENISHLYVICEERDKPDVLRKLIHAVNPDKAIVFVHRNETAEVVASKLAHHKVTVADLHGAYHKLDRKQAMDDFRSGQVQILIASDIASRGLDLPGVTHVFNLDAPSQSKDYLHRVGRTGRANSSGTAISLMTDQETRLVRRYHDDLGITVTRMILREGQLMSD
ncbi:MAG: DEAD/DEAH box helicase [Verrucomicrobiota bacterium]|nr:DEAD/DEAH box helicase [Verrucomicrobiota bacterium]